LDAAAVADLLKRAVDEGQIKISLHAAEEALAEKITRTDIEMVMLNAQVLEDYPDWWLGSSCLIYGRSATGRDLHIVVSYTGLPVTIVTVYEPRPPKWITPTRRRSRKK
jgi:hypothetical protein